MASLYFRRFGTQNSMALQNFKQPNKSNGPRDSAGYICR